MAKTRWGIVGRGVATFLWVSFACGWFALGAEGVPPAARREALLRASGPGSEAVLAAGLNDENLVVRRTAARLLTQLGATAEASLAKAFGNDDALVRRTVLRALCGLRPERAVGWAERGMADADPAVRRVALDWLIAQESRAGRVLALLVKARGDGDAAVRAAASAALFPFQRENISLRDRKDYDHDVRVVQAIPLPVAGWQFRTDPVDEGHLKGWFRIDVGGTGWSGVEVGKTWEAQGREYDGVAWYRVSLDLPAKPAKVTAVDLAFDGVDEAAWVWFNGEYVGSHDLGKAGWNKAFRLDVTQELRWGGKNVLAVRVFDSASAGGIWKPVRVEVLE